MSLKNQDKLIELTEAEQDCGVLTGADFQIENEDQAKKKRALREADVAGKSQLGSPAAIRNKVKPLRKSKSRR